MSHVSQTHYRKCNVVEDFTRAGCLFASMNWVADNITLVLNSHHFHLRCTLPSQYSFVLQQMRDTSPNMCYVQLLFGRSLGTGHEWSTGTVAKSRHITAFHCGTCTQHMLCTEQLTRVMYATVVHHVVFLLDVLKVWSALVAFHQNATTRQRHCWKSSRSGLL